MAYRPRTYRRKRTYRRRPYYLGSKRRSVGKPTVRRLLPSLTLKRKFFLRNFTPSTASTSGFWNYEQISFNQLPSVSEFVALFDTYQIRALRYDFVPRYDNYDGSNTTDTTLPGVTNQGKTWVHIVNDPLSTVSPSGTYVAATLNGFMENGNVRTRDGNRPFSVYFKPAVDMTIGNVRGTFVRSPKIQTSQTSITHNGFHWFVQDVGLTGTFNQSFDIYVTMYLRLTNLK